ncbi:hypothetical protein NUW58_g8293 [Xylaria curta]|uniref:Uncharacterized protein n=1 Tax=Xylaria curta TaxID=42375 RepID=A0ACC1NB29_9PEZI|nr:hypothetical protein NUW58_g8293 [Xylaria curta]
MSEVRRPGPESSQPNFIDVDFWGFGQERVIYSGRWPRGRSVLGGAFEIGECQRVENYFSEFDVNYTAGSGQDEGSRNFKARWYELGRVPQKQRRYALRSMKRLAARVVHSITWPFSEHLVIFECGSLEKCGLEEDATPQVVSFEDSELQTKDPASAGTDTTHSEAESEQTTETDHLLKIDGQETKPHEQHIETDDKTETEADLDPEEVPPEPASSHHDGSIGKTYHKLIWTLLLRGNQLLYVTRRCHLGSPKIRPTGQLKAVGL